MIKASFEKVKRGASSEAFKDENRLNLKKSVGDSTSETVREHVYIVFSGDISIENGIETIENKILSGDLLEVSRFDVRGHAAVAIVSTSIRKKIEDLPIVEKVKVMEALHPTVDKAAPVTSYTK